MPDGQGDRAPASWDLVLQMLNQIDARIGLLVSQEVHKAAQEATAQRLRDQAEDLMEWKAESRGEHVALHAEIRALNIDLRAQLDNYREKQVTLERQARDQEAAAAKAAQDRLVAEAAAEKKERAARIFNIVMATFAFASSLAVGIILNAIGGG